MDRKFQRKIRAKRVRAKIEGRLRLSVFKSNRHLYAQIIDDARGHTLASASSPKPATIETAKEIGEKLAFKAKEAKI
ncbi:50S ribosomal protein L18, partial [Candidatus Berkelbacteria bacterium]|nr:50S ribosomal protein L18 [Candidatus Berkelbacteria bacterium]